MTGIPYFLAIPMYTSIIWRRKHYFFHEMILFTFCIKSMKFACLLVLTFCRLYCSFWDLHYFSPLHDCIHTKFPLLQNIFVECFKSHFLSEPLLHFIWQLPPLPPSGNSNTKNNLSYTLESLLISCSFGLPFSIISALCPTIKGGTPYSRSVAAMHSSDNYGLLYLLLWSPLGTASSWNIILVSGPKSSSLISFHVMTSYMNCKWISFPQIVSPILSILLSLLNSLKKVAACD